MKPAREPRPAFQTYAADEIADGAEMSLEEIGARLLLRAYAWREGSIPADLPRLGRLLRVGEEKMGEMWPAIERSTAAGEPGRLIFPDLEALRQEYEAHSAKQRDNINKRWDRVRAAKAQTDTTVSTVEGTTVEPRLYTPTPTPTPTSSTSSTSTTTTRETESPSAPALALVGVFDFDLESIYANHPRKESKQAGMTKLRKTIKTAQDHERFTKASANYAAHIKANPDRPALAWSSWADRWEEWVNGPPEGSTKGAPNDNRPRPPNVRFKSVSQRILEREAEEERNRLANRMTADKLRAKREAYLAENSSADVTAIDNELANHRGEHDRDAQDVGGAAGGDRQGGGDGSAWQGTPAVHFGR